MTNYYLPVLTVHIVAVICWMAGMLYLPRLFVYHVRAKPKSELSETLKIMEVKLLRFIMNPAMIVVFLSGGILFSLWPDKTQGWLHAKIMLVLLMAACHGKMAVFRKDFARDQNTKSEKYYRIFNEIPAVILVLIVILVVNKPF